MDRLHGHDEHHNIADDDQFHLAKRFYGLLKARVESFREKLPEGKVLGARVAGFGDNTLFYLEEIHYADPSLIAICGKTQDGMPFEIIQEVSHVNLSLLPLDAPR